MADKPEPIKLTKARPQGGQNYQVYDTEARAYVTHSCLGVDPHGHPRHPEDLIDARMVVAAHMIGGVLRSRFIILWDDLEVPAAEAAA